MLVRLRFALGPRIRRKRRTNNHLAAALAALLTPAAVMALAFGIWRIAADLSLASRFCIAAGPLSHWQSWLGLAVLLQFCSHCLNRYGKTDDPSIS